MCIGINVCLLIQLSTKSQNKLWTTAITLSLFLVVSTCQFLMSYATLLGCTDHHEHSREIFVCTDIQPFAGSRAAVQWTGMIATLLPDFFVVRSPSDVSATLRLTVVMLALPVLYRLLSPQERPMGVWFSCTLPPLLIWYAPFTHSEPSRRMAECTAGSAIYLLMLSNDLTIKVLPHYPLCIFTKFLLTFLIVVKLLRQRRRLRKNFEDSPEGPIRPYTSLIYILVQSYALHASLSILFLGLYLAKNSAWRMVLPIHGEAGVRCSSLSYLKVTYHSCHIQLMSHLLVRSQVVRSRNENVHMGPGRDVPEPIRFAATNPGTSTTNTVGNV